MIWREQDLLILLKVLDTKDRNFILSFLFSEIAIDDAVMEETSIRAMELYNDSLTRKQECALAWIKQIDANKFSPCKYR